ncbi:MAG: single-stranded-DNA-specific exonuclease RecJ, partial [Methylotenera sp.]|nr:single-stranded-DNA-specific exonuclease RecJ [Methylotenera sp.]
MTKIVQRKTELQAEQQLQAAGLSSLMARLLAARGVTDATQLRANLSGLLPPSTLTNNVAMAKLLADAIAA